MSDISHIWQDYRRGKSQQYRSYVAKAHQNNQDSLVGYVADVTANDRLTNRYNITIPEINNVMLRQVPRQIPDGFVQANGVGISPPPLRPGQPVIIRFFKGRTSMPYIDGAQNLNGVYTNWLEDGPPGIDTKDPETGLTLWHSPVLPETLAAGGDAETKVWPLVMRSQAPGQGTNSATGLEIPGNTMVSDYSGNVFKTTVGQYIHHKPNEIVSTEGTRASLADAPVINAVKEASRVQAVVVEELAYWRTLLNGSYELVKPHPSNDGSVTSGSLTINPNSSTKFLEGSLTIPTGLSIPELPGGKEVDNVLDQIDSTLGFITEASKASGLQLDFLQKKIAPLIKLAQNLWGSFKKFQSINVSLDIPLPFNLQLSLSIGFDFKTGNITISGVFGSGGPRPGTLIPKQALPLSSEGGFTTGGQPRFKRPTYKVIEEVIEVTETTIYTRYPSLQTDNTVYVPESRSDNIPFVVVSRDLNELDFSSNPEEGLASFLTKMGVPKSGYIVKYLTDLIEFGDFFSFLSLLSTLSKTPKDRIIGSAISDIAGGGSSGSQDSIGDTIDVIAKPALNDCPPVPSEVYDISSLIKENNIESSKEALEDYFLEPIPDFEDWLVDIDSLLDWASKRDYPYYPAIKELSEGNVYDFLVLTIFIATSIDIEAYDNLRYQLDMLIQSSYTLPTVGVK